VSRYQKCKTNLDLLEQETVSGSGISCSICKSASHPRQITMPANLISPWLIPSWSMIGVVIASFVARTKLLYISTGMGEHLLVGGLPRYVAKPTRSTQPCIPPMSLNQEPALIGLGKGGNVTYAAWQVTRCSNSREAGCKLLNSIYLYC